jgi:hypothetical protein
MLLNFYSITRLYSKEPAKAEMDELENHQEKLMSDLLKNIIRFALFIALQVFVLNRIPHCIGLLYVFIFYFLASIQNTQTGPHLLILSGLH